MPAARTIAAFFARLAVTYAALLGLWFIVGGGYGTAFRFAGELVFGSLGPISIRFEEHHDGTPMDTNLVLKNAQTGARGQCPASSLYLGYLPLAFTAALVAATPLPWGRRGRALLWGLLAVHLYIGFRVGLKLLALLNGEHALAAFSLGQSGDSVVAFVADLFCVALAGCYLGPILIWMLVSFRRGDWQLAAGHART